MNSKWYSGKGDDGYTGVLGRERTPKYAARPEAYGTVDELSASLGLARAHAQDLRVGKSLLTIQRDLYNMMADLATVPEAATRAAWLEMDRLEWLEKTTDALGKEIDMPRAFIVPGDSVSGAVVEVARTVARRAERLVARLTHEGAIQNDTPLRYLNRLSSLLFVLARVEDASAGVTQFTLAADK